MTIRKAFVESTYGRHLLATSRPTPLVWQWWERVENAYKRMWPGEEMLEPPTQETRDAWFKLKPGSSKWSSK